MKYVAYAFAIWFGFSATGWAMWLTWSAWRFHRTNEAIEDMQERALTLREEWERMQQRREEQALFDFLERDVQS